MTPISHVKTYDELTGGEGKNIFLRQSRSTMSELLGGLDSISHFVEVSGMRGEVVDLTTNGLAFSWSHPRTLAGGTCLDEFRVVVGEEELYRGSAMVRYSRLEEDKGTIVGASMLDGIVDTRRLNEIVSRAQLKERTVEVTETITRSVDSEYKTAISDLVFLLSSYRSLLAEQDKAIARLSPIERLEQEREILNTAETEFRVPYTDLREKLNRLALAHTDSEYKAHKSYTEAVLHLTLPQFG